MADDIFNPFTPVEPTPSDQKGTATKNTDSSAKPKTGDSAENKNSSRTSGKKEATPVKEKTPAPNHQLALADKMVGESSALLSGALSVVGEVMSLGEKPAIAALQLMPKLPGMASLTVAGHFSPVLGLDVHFVRIPPSPMVPLPHPYVGMVFDPRDFISAMLLSVATQFVPPATSEEGDGAAENMIFAGLTMAMSMLGATVLVNGVPRAVTGVKSQNMHFPFGAGFSLPIPLKNKGHVQFGSLTVAADGDPLTGMMHLNNDCWDIGMPALLRPKRKNTETTVYMPTGVVLPIPAGKPVLVNPIPTPINPQNLLFKFGGMGFAKLKRWKKGSKTMKGLALKAHGKVGKLMDKLKIPQGLRNAVHKAVCTVFGHPVDAASGRLFTDNEDFSLPGPIPLVWERTWYSDSDYQGPLGHGWHHSYDMALTVEEGEGIAAVRLNDGRVAGFDLPLAGQSDYNRSEKLTLHHHVDGYYYLREGLLEYHFTEKGYQGVHLLASITDQNGFSIQLTYNFNGYLSQIIDSAGRILRVENDDKGRITSIQAPHPEREGESFVISRYTYDQAGDMMEWSNALHHSMQFVYKNHLLIEEVWRNGLRFFFEYEGEQTGARCVRTFGDNNLLHYTFRYESAGITHATNSLGHTTTLHHRGGLVYKTLTPGGAEWQSHYNEYNELVEEVDPLGHSTAYAYDERGNRITVIYPDNGTIQISYNPEDQPIAATDTMGGKWKWQYNGVGNLVRKTDPLAASVQYQYQKGLLHTVTDVNGAVTTLHYDLSHNLSQVDYANGLRETFLYDKLGRCKTATDVRGSNTLRQYDLLGRVTQVAEWDGNTRYLTYDALDNVIHYKDKLREVKMSYKGLWKLSSRSESGATLQFTYDSEGQLRTVINEKGERYRFELDSEGEVISETGFDELSRKYERNKAGWVERLLRPDGKATAYGYDTSGRVVEVAYSNGTSESYSYDRAGRLTKATNAEAEIVLERDIVGRVIKESSNGQWVASSFDGLGNRTHISSSMGAGISHEFDSWGNTITRQSKGWQSRIQRDKFGLEQFTLLPGDIRSHWKRDQKGRITGHWVTKGSGNMPQYLRDSNYEWDVEDRLKSLTDPLGGIMQFDHDSFGNLTKTTFGDGKQQLRNPDPVGNLYESKDRSDRRYDKGGKLLESKGGTYKYDKEGNLVEKKEKNGKVWFYEWNQAGMLAKVTRPDKIAVTFGYDALGRRVWKRVQSTITRWIWDGNKPLHEWKEHALTGEILSDTTVGSDGVITWLFDEDSFAPVAKLKGEKKYSILTDHLGTPVQMYQEDGTKFWQGELDSYGRMRMERGEAGSCPFRYYNPEEGVYISQDPIRLEGGSKLYGYVDDPLILIDKYGLSSTVLNGNIGGSVGDNMEAHHLITEEVWGKHQNMFDTLGMDMDGKKNGILMPSSDAERRRVGATLYHRGSHPDYSDYVDGRVTKIESRWIPGVNDIATKRKLEKLQKRLKGKIKAGNVPRGKVSYHKIG